MSELATPRTDDVAKPIEEGIGYECDAMALLNLCRQLERELAEANRRLAEAEKDAERYRWLRNNDGTEIYCNYTDDRLNNRPHNLDATIAQEKK